MGVLRITLSDSWSFGGEAGWGFGGKDSVGWGWGSLIDVSLFSPISYPCLSPF